MSANTTVNDEFSNIQLPAGAAAVDYLFGERPVHVFQTAVPVVGAIDRGSKSSTVGLRRKIALLDREVLHRPIGKTSLRGGLDKNGGCPRNRLAPRLFDTLNCATAFGDCSHWS